MKRFILPITALLLAILYFFPYLTGGNKNTAFLITLKPEEIEKVYIKREGSEYEFIKENNHWKMIKPIQWKADETKIKRLLEAMKETVLETPVSDKDYQRYNIKDNGDFIQVYSKQKAQKILIGKRGARYSLIYIKPQNDRNVYLVRARFVDRMPAGENDFRDRTIFQTDPSRIKAIYWKEGNKTFLITRGADGWYVGNKKENKINSQALKEYLDTISNIDATGFLKNDRLPEGAKKIGFLSIKADRETKIHLYKKDSEFYLQISDRAFRISSFLKERLFKKL